MLLTITSAPSSRITEKSRGPAIGKAETGADEEDASTDTPDSLPAVVKINKPLDPSVLTFTLQTSRSVSFNFYLANL